jgi:hypothetical protein
MENYFHNYISFSLGNKFALETAIFATKAVFVFPKLVSGKPLSKLSCVCLPLGKLVTGKHFTVKGKFGLISRKVFSFYFKHFLEAVKNLEMSYYLLIISNLVLKLLIAIYILF